MYASRALVQTLFLLLWLGCDTDTIAPSRRQPSPPLVKPELRIIADDIVTLDRGASIVFTVEYWNSTGGMVSRPLEEYQWVSTRPEVLSVAANGVLTAGPELGRAEVIARASTGESDTVLVWVQALSSDQSKFKITLVYAEDVPQDWRNVLQYAAERWEQAIRGPLPMVELHFSAGAIPTPSGEPLSPPFTGPESGVRIYVGQSGKYPPGTYVEAIGGPVFQRALPYPTTILGQILLNRDKPVGLIEGDRLRYLAVHEMGHALGLTANVLGFQPEWFEPISEITRGTMTLEGYRRQFQIKVTSLDVSNGNHWPFAGDLMSAIPPNNRITAVSIGALMDLGYPAAWYGGGDY